MAQTDPNLMPTRAKVAVFFDENPFLGNPSGGIARSTVGLAEALARRAIPVMALGFRKSHFLGGKIGNASACEWRYLPWISRKSGWIRRMMRRLHFSIFCRLKNRGYGIIYHSNGIGSDPWISRRADLHVMTVHDLIPERLDPPGPANKTSAVFQKKASLKTAHGVIWVSRKTRHDFRRYYPRIGLVGQVIPHGRPQVHFFRPHMARRDHFLIVGNRGGYKNAVLAYRALSLFPAQQRPLLCLAGGESPEPEEMQLWDELGITSSIRWKDCTEKELAHFYSKAIAVVVPSKIEGFGLPALEAMAHGRVVICLKGSGVDEVVKDAGVVLSSGTPRKLFQSMRTLLSPSRRKGLEKKALQRSQHFDWNQTATKTNLFYRQLLVK